MRALLLFLLTSSISFSYTQTVEDTTIIAHDYCSSIVDSLKKTGYFRKALQINLNEVPTKANVTVYGVSGCLVATYNMCEFLYSDGVGYILYSRPGFQAYYLNENFTTEISRRFVIDCGYPFPRMEPLPPINCQLNQLQ